MLHHPIFIRTSFYCERVFTPTDEIQATMASRSDERSHSFGLSYTIRVVYTLVKLEIIIKQFGYLDSTGS